MKSLFRLTCVELFNTIQLSFQSSNLLPSLSQMVNRSLNVEQLVLHSVCINLFVINLYLTTTVCLPIQCSLPIVKFFHLYLASDNVLTFCFI